MHISSNPVKLGSMFILRIKEEKQPLVITEVIYLDYK